MKRKPQPWINFVICFLLILGFILSSVYWEERVVVKNAPSKKTPITEARGVWLRTVDNSLFAPSSNTASIMSSLAQSHFNTLYPVVWSRGETFFPSGVANSWMRKPIASGLSFFRREPDPLLAAVNEGHRQNIKVVPCFEGGLAVPKDSIIGTYSSWMTTDAQGKKNLPFNPVKDSIIGTYSSWMTTDAQGKKNLPSNTVDEEFNLIPKPPSNNAIKKWFQSHEQKKQQQLVWINPLHPDARKFIKGLILEVVSKYDIDGIQLDEHFSWPVRLGYDSLTVYSYQREHGGKSPPADPHDPGWMYWRASKLTDFVAEISRSIKDIKPNITISLASPLSLAYDDYLVDWKNWIDQGLINELIVKNFQYDSNLFQAQLNALNLQPMLKQLPISIGILAGTWDYPVEIQSLAQQVQMVRKAGFLGFSFFDWDSLWGYGTPNAPQRRREGFNLLFSERAIPPTFIRKTPSSSPP